MQEGIEVGLKGTESQNEQSKSPDEDTLHVNSQETSDEAQTEDAMTTPPPTKIKKVFVSPKPKNVQTRAGGEDPRIGHAYAALQTALTTKKDEFDVYGEYIANILRSMDKQTYAYVKKEFGEIIFKAESGIYASRVATQAQFYCPAPSPDYSRPSSRDSDNSYRSSHGPVEPTSGPSVATPQQNVAQCQSLSQNLQSHYLQLDTQGVLPSNNNASSQLLNLDEEDHGYQWQ